MPAASAPVFDRFGRAYHLRIRDADDLEQVLALDSAQWVATTASTRTLDADPVLLERLDTNGDGHVRTDDVRSAVRHLLTVLNDRGGIESGRTVLGLNTLDIESDAGQALRETARKILQRRGTPDAASLTLAQVRAVKEALVQRGLSEAGRVPPEAASDERLEQFLRDVVAAAGDVAEAGGAPAVTEASLARFLHETRLYVDWLDHAGAGGSEVLPLGPATADAHALVEQLAPKIDQYFTLVDAVQLDPELAEHAWPGRRQLDAVDFMDADALGTFLADAPLARPDPRGVLDLDASLNPRHAAALRRLRDDVLAPLLGEAPDVLTREQWREVQQRLAPYAAWQRARPETAVRTLPADRLRAYLEDTSLAEAARALLAESRVKAVELDDVRRVEEVILYQAHLLRFVNSFVSFPHLYDAHDRALFEMGTLVMDGRRFELCVRVTDRAQHVRFSDDSNMFVLYVSVRSREGEERYEVAVPVTSGGRGNLRVGKRGVFYDRDGREHHAQVVHLVENPISLREALTQPFRRLGEAMSAAVERIGAARERRLLERGEGAVTRVAEQRVAGGTEPAPAAASPSTPAAVATSPAGLLAGGAVAVAALGSSFAFVARTLGALPWTALVGGLLVLGLAVLIPIVVVAWLRLRRRDLSAILEGSDWGVNARMRLTRRQARTFTARPDYPRGTRRSSGWFWGIAALALVATLALLVG